MRIRIRFRDNGSGTGSGSVLKSNKFKFFPYFFSVKGLKRITMFFFIVIWAYYSCRILNKIPKWFIFKKNYIFIILVYLYEGLSRFFFTTRIQITVSWIGSGPGQKMIRIQPDPRIRNTEFILLVLYFLFVCGGKIFSPNLTNSQRAGCYWPLGVRDDWQKNLIAGPAPEPLAKKTGAEAA